MRVPSFCVRNRGQERCRLARASWKAATVVLLSGLRDSFMMAAFSLSSRPRWATCRKRRSRALEDKSSSRHISQMNRPPQHTLNNPFTISINRPHHTRPYNGHKETSITAWSSTTRPPTSQQVDALTSHMPDVLGDCTIIVDYPQ